MTMHKGLSSTSNVGRVHSPIQTNCTRLLIVEDPFMPATLRLECYLRQRDENLICSARMVIDNKQELPKIYKGKAK